MFYRNCSSQVIRQFTGYLTYKPVLNWCRLNKEPYRYGQAKQYKQYYVNNPFHAESDRTDRSTGYFGKFFQEGRLTVKIVIHDG